MAKITDGWNLYDPEWMKGEDADQSAADRDAPKKRRRGSPQSLTVQFGQANGQSTLTEAEVGEILRLAETMRQYEIARHFGISEAHVSRILNGKAWLHGSAQRKMADYLKERDGNDG